MKSVYWRGRRFQISPFIGAVFLRLLAATVSTGSIALADSFTLSNPLINREADPDIYKHTDGFYYFTATVPEYDRIILRRASTIDGLSTASETVIWTKHASGIMGAHIWAPEIHFINGKWYIYFAAGSSREIWASRIYVLENASANPLTAAWIERGQIDTHNWASFSLDATTFINNGKRYLVWAQKDPALSASSNLYIAAMGTDPWTVVGTPTMISQPTFDWEKIGVAVNEGPAVLIRNGKVFLAYSAARTDANYCLGLLTAPTDSNLLSAASWKKSPNAVFKSGNGAFGPGHNQFTVSPDGSVDLLVYHARNYETIVGDPIKDPNRSVRVQQLKWNADGTPNFGTPVGEGTITIGNTDLAAGKVSSADSSQSSHPPSAGNDSAASTRWSANNGAPNHWWKVDLGSAHALTGSEVFWEWSGRIYQYKIETSVNDTAWTLVVDKTKNSSLSQIQADSFTSTARYVRITVTGLPASPVTWASFFQFQVFGR
jgi:GH43 family beta-xylosidase